MLVIAGEIEIDPANHDVARYEIAKKGPLP